MSSLRGWPLWAKIAAPVSLLVVIGSIGSATKADEQTDGTIPATTEVRGLADLPPATESVVTLAVPTTQQPDAIVAATVPPTPPPTPAPTAAPTVPPTPAPTPPPTPAPTTPPTPPPTAAPTLPPAAPPVVEPTTDPRFGTCKEAKSNGYGPYVRGVDPEYDWYRDSDHDGVDCE